MLPSGSNSMLLGARCQPVTTGQAGFTLLELLITMVVAVILGVTVHRFYKDSYHTYSMQEQIADRNQNAHFVLSRLVELFQQAGSSLPVKGWNVISIASGIITLGTNPRGIEQYNSIDTPSSPFIALVDAAKFKNSGNVRINTTHVLIENTASGKTTLKVAIDDSYNSGGFTGGIKDNVTGMDSIKLVSNVDLDIGDKIYAYREDQIILANGELILRPNGNPKLDMVMAEGIDSLGITFLAKDGSATSNWAIMKSASIVVRARTEKIDPHLSPPGYHKITLPMNIRFRNKV
jgi:prepilin-type N-terminal cleavage/methylation domain-containing protein